MAETLVRLRLAASAVQQYQIWLILMCHAGPSSSQPIPSRTTVRPGLQAVVVAEVNEDDAMRIDNLCRFFDLNVGKWNGFFYQFVVHGRVLQGISTRLLVSICWEGKSSLSGTHIVVQLTNKINVGTSSAIWVVFGVVWRSSE